VTLEQAAEVVKFALAGYPGQRSRMTSDDVKGMVMFYAAGLEDVDVDVARAAITRLALTVKFIPTVAEIREAVGAVHHGEQSPAMVAWDSVHRAIREKGIYRRPGVDFHWNDPVVAAVVASIGWEDLCSGAQDHIRARFIDGYAQISRDLRKQAALSEGGKHPTLPAGTVVSHARIDREGDGRTMKQLMSTVLTPVEE